MTDTSEPPEPEASPVATQRRLKDIVRSTVIVGGGSVVTVLCGAVRGKIISTVVGPAGIGLQGLLQSTLRTTSSVAGMSLGTSGVREVARLRETDPAELGHTLRALWLTTLGFGGLAALVMVLFRRPIGSALLGDPSLSWTIGVVGVGVFAQVLYSVYDSYLRGFRRVALLTKAAVLANVMGTMLGTGLVLLFGENGIVGALIAQPVFVLGIAAFVGRDISGHYVPPDRARSRQASARLVRMGVVLTITGFVSTAVQLVARVLVERFAGLDSVGYFQGAWAVSVLYLGFVLGAMSLDYYPRLAAAGKDRAVLSQMVNEQARISLLLAGPAVLGLLTFSGQVIALLYTSKFAATVEILRWQLLGDVLKIGSWTLSYLVLAQGSPRAYFFTELTWNVIYLGVLAALLPTLGVNATAAAYVAACIGYFSVLYLVANRLAGFKWVRSNVILMCAISGLSIVAMAAHLLLVGWLGLLVGGALTALFGVYCLRRLVREVGLARLFRRGKARK